MGYFPAVTSIIFNRINGVKDSISKNNKVLFISLMSLLEERSLFTSLDQNRDHRDLCVQLNVFCHYALRSDDLALVSMCLKPPSIALILSLAEPMAKKPSNDFLERVYLASKRSASDCRQTVIDHLKQAPLPFQVDMVCEFSTWMNPCVGLVMLDWLLDQCLEERNKLLDHKQRVTLNKQEKKQSLKIILSVMTSVYNGFSVFLHHSGHVKARHVERCMCAFHLC